MCKVNPVFESKSAVGVSVFEMAPSRQTLHWCPEWSTSQNTAAESLHVQPENTVAAILTSVVNTQVTNVNICMLYATAKGITTLLLHLQLLLSASPLHVQTGAIQTSP